MKAWRQLHRHIRDSPGTPIPLEVTFPWGKQQFWGSGREYLWFRTLWAPKPLACGFMALEEWCFSELERDRPVDELIQQIVENNDCIAILGVAVALALHMEEAPSEAAFSLVTIQRLWFADHNRMVQDLSASTTNLMGFNRADRAHIEAIQRANAREVRKKQLSWLAPRYVFGGERFAERTRKAILGFRDELPFEYEEHRNLTAARQQLTAKALEYAELADPKNYQAYKVAEDPGRTAIVHVSPTASAPEQIAKVEEAKSSLQEGNLWTWAAKSFENGELGDALTLQDAIALAKKIDSKTLFAASADDELVGMRRGAVASVAAITLDFRQNCGDADLSWARRVLKRAIGVPEKRDLMWSSDAIIPWHQAIFVARGLGADLRQGTGDKDAALALLGLVTHPLEVVSLAAAREACRLWGKDPKLAWSALLLAFSLCHIQPRPPGKPRGPSEPVHSEKEIRAALDVTENFYPRGKGWRPLPIPPPAWEQLTGKQIRRRGHDEEIYDGDDVTNPTQVWGEPSTYWYSQYAAKILALLPLEGILASDAKESLQNFLSDVLTWTNQKNAPPWEKPHRRRAAADLYEWTHELGETLGRMSGFLTLEEIKPRFLEPILSLEEELCWALLSPFTSTYVCAYIYDGAAVPKDAITILDHCLGRLLEASCFKRDSYRSGELSGFDQPRLVETLMFVSVEQAALAARYVNGDWSEIDRILPLIDRFVRTAGWAASVMGPFLTLCERAKKSYPAEAFADQVLTVIGDGSDKPKGWHGTFIPARIAGLTQHFADRDSPMPLHLAQKFLRILDILVDMGDRRSAALQLGEAFREVRASG